MRRVIRCCCVLGWPAALTGCGDDDGVQDAGVTELPKSALDAGIPWSDPQQPRAPTAVGYPWTLLDMDASARAPDASLFEPPQCRPPVEDPLARCLAERCCTESTQCSRSTACTSLMVCILRCGNDANCRRACLDGNLQGEPLVSAYLGCELERCGVGDAGGSAL